MPPGEDAFVREAKINHHATIVADANDLKANGEHSIDSVRRAERDALYELAESFDSVDDVYAVALPSDRLVD